MAPYGQKDNQANLPNPTQNRVLEWVDKQRAIPVKEHLPVLYVQGGVGSGKSRALMAPVMEMLTEIPGLHILWVRQDLKDLKLSIVDKFLELFPAELITNKNEQMGWYEIAQEGGTRSRIYFNGAKDLGGLGSQEFGAIIVTEAHQISEQAYRTLKRRCRQENAPNIIMMEGEAPNEGHWLAKITNPTDESYDPEIEMWTISTYENWDNLPTAYRGSLESMPEAWKRKYLLGTFGFIPDGRPYYQGFKEMMHTGEFEWIPSKPLICGWDFGFHHPALLITQIDDQDRWLWLREIIGSEITIDKFGDLVKSQLNMLYPNAQTIHYGDPAVIQKNDKSELTSWQILSSKGITIRYRTSEYRLRKEIIEQKMSRLIGGRPSIMLDSRHCKTSIDGFLGGYHYPIQKDGQAFSGGFELPFKDGFYEHCLSENTKIRTLDGWHNIKDLVGKEFITYAYDNFSKRLIPVKARECRKTQIDVELWKLTFDNGELIATPDHLIMLRNGSYKQLKDLQIQDELMPFYEKIRSLKVLSIEFYGYGDTYNLEVDNCHNFPANGIIVHNCMNAGEYIAVNLFSPIARRKVPRRQTGPKSLSNI